MTRLPPDIRALCRRFAQKGLKINKIAELLGTSRQTVHHWLKRAKHRGRESFKDRSREAKKGKITVEVETSIFALRSLGWGTARIQQGLYCLPK